ncbi:hypothetical protein SDC9_19581 [bioreactor metagenome]|uniref:Uncharacterized protein n=1 Tax=bioreactor metagenome TaxID=1076179 RepID=A0A644U4C6_9ZZZZ
MWGLWAGASSAAARVRPQRPPKPPAKGEGGGTGAQEAHGVCRKVGRRLQVRPEDDAQPDIGRDPDRLAQQIGEREARMGKARGAGGKVHPGAERREQPAAEKYRHHAAPAQAGHRRGDQIAAPRARHRQEAPGAAAEQEAKLIARHRAGIGGRGHHRQRQIARGDEGARRDHHQRRGHRQREAAEEGGDPEQRRPVERQLREEPVGQVGEAHFGG